jgi:membrane protein DedA with SNARE-associated domain/membrane-associated phospholipid phosphatase
VPVIAGIVDWILSLHGGAALAIVFGVPALEASAFVGFLFPGEIAVVLGGVLAYQGRVPLAAVIVAAVTGAILGDTIGYFIGRRWGRRILRFVIRRLPLLGRRVDHHLDTAEAYLQRRGGAAVFVGRFTAALRVMVPGLAGMARMPYSEFAAYNAAGGIAWGTTFVLLGYFGGAAWRRVAGVASRAGLALLALILIGLIATRVLRAIREGGESATDRLARVRPVAWARRRYPGQAAWLARRVDPRSPSGFLLSAVAVSGGLCAWLFGGLTQDIVAREEAVRWDPGIERFAVAHRTEWLTAFMKGVTWLGSSLVLIPLVVAVAASFLIRRRDRVAAVGIVASYAGAVALYDIVKGIVGRPRPSVTIHLVGVSGSSFPSGHATLAVAVWGMVAVLGSPGRSPATRALLWGWALVVALLVGTSRIYLGVHWMTDVLGGSALGGMWLCLLVAGAIVRSSRPRTRDTVRPDLG